MSTLPLIAYPGRQVWIGLLITGVMFLIAGFVIWFLFLGVALVLPFLKSSRHTHQAAHDTTQFISLDWLLGLGYAGAFFLAAMVVARSRWSYRPGMAALIGYAAFLMVYLPVVDWTRASFFDTICLLTPLVSGLLGGLLGERFFAWR